MATKRAAKEKEPKAKVAPLSAKETLERNREEAAKFAKAAGRDRLLKLLERSHAELGARIEVQAALRIAKGDEKKTFTEEQARVLRAQVALTARRLSSSFGGVVAENAEPAGEMGARHVASLLEAGEAEFRGIASPLPLRVASMVDRAGRGARASVLRRLGVSGEGEEGAPDFEHPAKGGILDRYGLAVVGDFEDTIQQALLTRRPWGETLDDLTEKSAFLKGAPRFWAERILRTESMNAYGQSSNQAAKEADEELGDVVKILAATFDERTSWDSYLVHGEIRRPGEMFEGPFGAYDHPPNRPNDREIVVTHRISWPIPDYLKPRSVADAQAAWRREGRKGAMPPRTWAMETVARESFGAKTASAK